MQEIILKKKRNLEQEYTIHLFEWCNLSCAFCWQDHNAPDGLTDIMSKLGPIGEYFREEAAEYIVLNIMGGEIFADEIFDADMLETYKAFVNGIKAVGDKYDKKVSISWVTNLVTDKLEEIDALMEHTDNVGVPNRLSTSYDRKARFNILNLEKFKRNMTYFGSKVDSVNMLFSKKAIKELITENDPYFEEIYKTDTKIYIDYMMPDSTKADVPSDQDLYDAFTYLIDNYPKVEPIASWMTKRSQPLSCRTSKLVLPDGTSCQCGNLIEDDVNEEVYGGLVEADSNHSIENLFIEKYGCASCEYLDRCQLSCFMQHAAINRVEFDECVYKKTHRYIDAVEI